MIMRAKRLNFRGWLPVRFHAAFHFFQVIIAVLKDPHAPILKDFFQALSPQFFPPAAARLHFAVALLKMTVGAVPGA